MTTTELIKRYEEQKVGNMEAYRKYCRQPDRELILNVCYLSPYALVSMICIAWSLLG